MVEQRMEDERFTEIARRKQRVEVSLEEARARAMTRWWGAEAEVYWETEVWKETWLWAWPQAKMRAMEEEVKAWRSGQPWAEVWTRKEAEVWALAMEGWCGGEQAWARAWVWAQKKGPAQQKVLAARREWREGREAEGRAVAMQLAHLTPAYKALVERGAWEEMRGEATAVAEALALAGVWARARGEAHAHGDKAPPGLTDSETISRILSNHHSREMTEDYSTIIHFIAPITLLPSELLHQIFLIILDESRGPPLVLMLVCKRWHAIVTSVWASLNLGTTTPVDLITRKLGRNQWLDIAVDTDADRGNFTPSDRAFEALFAAIEASSRWRSLLVESLPAQADLPADIVNRGLQRCPNAPMSRFTIFKIKSSCMKSPLLDGLLRILGTTARELTTVEINSTHVVSFLVPVYPSIFHSVKVLSLDTPGTPSSVDLLPHLHQLETFTASHISFPIYHDDVSLPFIHTLRHLSLKAASIQWMSGRTFHVLENCTLTFPLHHQALHTFSTTLPNCEHFTFQGYPLSILGGISAPRLSHLSVTCSSPSHRRANQQMVQLSRRVLGEGRLRPRILHISIEAGNQAWMNALGSMSHLEELVIHNARPSSLGPKVFRALIVQPVFPGHLVAGSTHEEFGASLCPSLRRFGLKYDRWLRSTEQFGFIPVFVSVIRSRRYSNHPLNSFLIWTTSGDEHPLELVEGSDISANGLGRLAEKSGIRGDLLGHLIDANSPEASGNYYSHSPATTTPQLGSVLKRFWNRLLGSFRTVISIGLRDDVILENGSY